MSLPFPPLVKKMDLQNHSIDELVENICEIEEHNRVLQKAKNQIIVETQQL